MGTLGLRGEEESYRIAVRVSDANGAVEETETVTLRVAGELVVEDVQPAGQYLVGDVYNETLTVDGGYPPYDVRVVEGPFSVDGTVVSGELGEAGPITAVVRVEDDAGFETTQEVSLGFVEVGHGGGGVAAARGGSEGAGMSGGVIAGVVVGCNVLFVAVGYAVCWQRRRVSVCENGGRVLEYLVCGAEAAVRAAEFQWNGGGSQCADGG